ncbi:MULTISPECIES: hypothetical protein [Ensifer]|uniref:hypothetical protein n=1 Tax=Ensifer TaxID=106591 RepID=UPI0012E3B520|nr:MULTISPECIES: hypothetical protein [Ensifer]NOV19334.1 hypothetical protein [Ensifer canadensis]
MIAFLTPEVVSNFVDRDVTAKLQEVTTAIAMRDAAIHAVDLDNLAGFLGLCQGMHALATG